MYAEITNIFIKLYIFLHPKSSIFSETLVKRKWKNLRDQFAVELGKFTPRTGDAAGDTQTSKWQYFKSLHFLKDVVKPRASTGNFSSLLAKGTAETSLPGPSQVRNQTDGVESPLDEEECVPASPTLTQDVPVRGDEDFDKQRITSNSSRPKKQTAGKRPKKEDYNQSILDIERQIMQYLIENSSRKRAKDDDEDLMFFKSLLPHVKKIPDANKLTFRSHIQELVQQFAYQVPITSPLPHTSSSPVSARTLLVSPDSYEHTLSPVETQIYATDSGSIPM